MSRLFLWWTPLRQRPVRRRAGCTEWGFPDCCAQIAAGVRPAVVQMTNEQVQVGQLNQPFTVPSGVGSGVLYDSEGHLLTSDHVAEGAQQLLVSLPDGRSFPGTLVGTDPQTDVAVVQITGDNLPQAALGDSQELQVGDSVVAIGNVLALSGGPTVTQGVFSALGRSVQEPGNAQEGPQVLGPTLFDASQTDAPINPGNSGGPMTNLQGQVIGINTLVAGQAEPGVQAQGIGFAIAIDTAGPIADKLIVSGHAVHPSLGIRFVALNPVIAAQLGTQATSGAVVVQVTKGSPAAASLQPRDVITQVGRALSSDTDLAGRSTPITLATFCA
jgi:serine protease Do